MITELADNAYMQHCKIGFFRSAKEEGISDAQEKWDQMLADIRDDKIEPTNRQMSADEWQAVLNDTHSDQAIAEIPWKYQDVAFDRNDRMPNLKHFETGTDPQKIALLIQVKAWKRYGVNILCGDTHRGKTHLLYCIMKNAASSGMTPKYLRWKSLETMFSQRGDGLTMDMTDGGKKRVPIGHIHALDDYDPILIDDYNNLENPKGVLGYFFELIDHRTTLGKKIILVSNLEGPVFASSFQIPGLDMWDKIKSRMEDFLYQFIDFSKIEKYELKK